MCKHTRSVKTKNLKLFMPGFFFVTIVIAALVCSKVNALPAFPGAEGFGSQTIGGRYGTVIKVTNLNDAGPGSFREAVLTPGPRIVVFDVSGIINLTSEIFITEPYLIIAGQTSPGGILITGRTIIFNTHDVMVRHVRFRVGSHNAVDPETHDAVNVWGDGGGNNDAYNIIFDHCSISWGIDENFSIVYNAREVTVQWCIISEGLSNAGHPDGEHSKGLLISGKSGGSDSISVHHNYFVHNTDRNPLIGASVDYRAYADIVNNVVYNFHGNLSMISQMNGYVNFVHNYVKKGPESNAWAFEAIHYAQGGDSALIYVEGNLGCRRTTQSDPEWCVGRWWYNEYEDTVYRQMTRWPAAPITTTQMSHTYPLDIINNVGATKPVRDSVDIRIVADYVSGTGQIIDNVVYPDDYPSFANLPPPVDTDNDGMPDAWEITYGLNPNDPSDGPQDTDGDGYTNIEEYLNETDPTVGIEESSAPIYSNHCRVHLSQQCIAFENLSSGDAIKVFDTAGRLVHNSGYLSTSVYQWNFAGISSGVYFYLITSTNHEKTYGKIVIIR